MGGTAGSGQTAGQDAPEDLVSVREAAQAVGFSPAAVHSWVTAGRLAVPMSSQGRRVSLAAVRALCAPADPQTPPEARLVYEVAQAVRLDRDRIRGWARRGLLPSWHGSHGLLVREVDVRALAQQSGALDSAATAHTPLPSDFLLISDAARQAGMSRGRLYTWIRHGVAPVWPETGGRSHVRLADVMALVERTPRAVPPSPERDL